MNGKSENFVSWMLVFKGAESIKNMIVLQFTLSRLLSDGVINWFMKLPVEKTLPEPLVFISHWQIG